MDKDAIIRANQYSMAMFEVIFEQAFNGEKDDDE